jgi:hypothetical protein
MPFRLRRVGELIDIGRSRTVIAHFRSRGIESTRARVVTLLGEWMARPAPVSMQALKDCHWRWPGGESLATLISLSRAHEDGQVSIQCVLG